MGCWLRAVGWWLTIRIFLLMAYFEAKQRKKSTFFVLSAKEAVSVQLFRDPPFHEL
jgi:hypothetical protein